MHYMVIVVGDKIVASFSKRNVASFKKATEDIIKVTRPGENIYPYEMLRPQ